MRRIGELMPFAENDPEAQTRVGRFPTGPAAIGMDCRPQRADRLPLGRGCHGDDRWRHRPEAVLKADAEGEAIKLVLNLLHHRAMC